MSQYTKNTPWARAPATQQINPQIFTGQLLPNQFAGMGQMGLGGLGMVGNQLITGINAVSYGQQSLGIPQLMNRGVPQQAQPTVQKPPRTFVGIVTKMLENYGFVDDEVFFQTSVVKGPLPRINEKVMVEASYNPNMAFKWNAIRVQLLPDAASQEPERPAAGGGGGRWAPERRRESPPRRDRSPVRRSPPRRSPPRRRSPSPRRPAPPRESVSSGSGLKRERTRSRSASRRVAAAATHEGSTARHTRSRSPPRKVRAPGRYAVSVPKYPLYVKDMGIVELRRRYSNIYVPSDFVHTAFSWVDNFPIHRPFSLDHSVNYHVLHKDIDRVGIVDTANNSQSLWDPPDADYHYCAKVMLLCSPSLQDIYKKVIGLQDDATIKDHADSLQGINRVINFLVGVKGKESLAIGGPWSPSLDGADPENDPRVLIRTAVRTTRALTGLDLSKCTQWFKFLETRYRRIDKEQVKAEHSSDANSASASSALDNERSLANGHLLNTTSVEPRIDKVVVFVPDVWNIMPTKQEFDSLKDAVKLQLQAKLAELDKPDATDEVTIIEVMEVSSISDGQGKVEPGNTVTSAAATGAEDSSAAAKPEVL